MKHILICCLFFTTGCVWKSDLDKVKVDLFNTENQLYETKDELTKTKKELLQYKNYTNTLESEKDECTNQLSNYSKKLNDCTLELIKPKKTCDGGVCFKYD